MPPVRLFVGNLPYQATEDDLRTHFAQVGNPTQIVRPLDRETGRARGFAFVEYAERKEAEEAIKKFDGQLFMGRPLAVSEARAREDRGPGGPPRPRGGFGAPRPGGFSGGGGGYSGGGGGFGGPRPAAASAAGAVTAAAVAPAPARRARRTSVLRRRPRTRRSRSRRTKTSRSGPIPTKFTGRMFDLDDTEDDDAIDITPDFMKHEDPEVDTDDAEAPDAAPTTPVDTPDADDDEE